jgi:hypothetical protein
MASNPNEFAEAFQELLDAKTEALGKEEFVLLNGRKLPALVSVINIAEEIISGGLVKAGDFHCQIAQSIVAEEPRKGDSLECRGQELQVMSSNDINGVTYDLTAGDMASEAR